MAKYGQMGTKCQLVLLEDGQIVFSITAVFIGLVYCYLKTH